MNLRPPAPVRITHGGGINIDIDDRATTRSPGSVWNYHAANSGSANTRWGTGNNPLTARPPPGNTGAFPNGMVIRVQRQPGAWFAQWTNSHQHACSGCGRITSARYFPENGIVYGGGTANLATRFNLLMLRDRRYRGWYINEVSRTMPANKYMPAGNVLCHTGRRPMLPLVPLTRCPPANPSAASLYRGTSAIAWEWHLRSRRISRYCRSILLGAIIDTEWQNSSLAGRAFRPCAGRGSTGLHFGERIRYQRNRQYLANRRVQ